MTGKCKTCKRKQQQFTFPAGAFFYGKLDFSKCDECKGETK
jgi:hypothetical protein